MEDRWTSLDEEEHFGAMKHCLERERLLVASGTIGTNRAWAGRRLLGIQEYWSLILQDNVQSHNSIQFTQSMWISNAPSMLQVKEMRVGQMGWGVEDQRSGHWAGSSAVPLSQLEYCIYSSNILHTVQYNQMIYVEVKYASVITGKRCWRHDIELDCGVEGCTLAECAKLPALGVLFTLLISIQHLWWVTTCKPWTMNNLGNLLILPAFNEYSPFNENHVISMCNAGCSQSWWAESRSKWRRWAVEWAGSSQWGGEGLKMGKRKRVWRYYKNLKRWRIKRGTVMGWKDQMTEYATLPSNWVLTLVYLLFNIYGCLQSGRAEHLKELQSMGTRLAEDGPGVQRMENSSQWEESSSGEASIRLSSELVNSYEVRELFDRTW